MICTSAALVIEENHCYEQNRWNFLNFPVYVKICSENERDHNKFVAESASSECANGYEVDAIWQLAIEENSSEEQL